MGQKTHPIGLRVGIHTKWVSTWYGQQNTVSHPYAKTNKEYFLSKGNISSRGGNYLSGIEDFVESYLRRYSFSNLTKSRRFLPVAFYLFKTFGGHMYGFIFYTKLIIRRKK